MGTNDRVRNDAVRGRRARVGEERAVGEGKERRRATVGRDRRLPLGRREFYRARLNDETRERLTMRALFFTESSGVIYA